MENSVYQLSVSDFHLVKPGLTTMFAGVNEVLVLFIESWYRNFILNLNVTVRTAKS